MKIITQNEYYKIEINEDKNRVYFRIQGFWKSPAVVPNFLNDWETTIGCLKPGFTIVSDLTEMKPPAVSLSNIHEQAQCMLVAAGLSKTAEIISETVLLELQLKRYAGKSSMKKKEFSVLEEAEAWLDSNE
ncbi:MAG: hypothetical protein GY847_35255 [Proteobacteria bacterium]|nr:hypothetical protein [Pseudomonadota bacterium]